MTLGRWGRGVAAAMGVFGLALAVWFGRRLLSPAPAAPSDPTPAVNGTAAGTDVASAAASPTGPTTGSTPSAEPPAPGGALPESGGGSHASPPAGGGAPVLGTHTSGTTPATVTGPTGTAVPRPFDPAGRGGFAPPAPAAAPAPANAASGPVAPAGKSDSAPASAPAPGNTGPAATPAAPVQGTVKAGDVYVRSGPSLNHYPTGKVQAGDKLTIVGEKAGWLEVRAPAGQFSWISVDFVKPDVGRTGRAVVAGENVRVRAGSDIMPAAKDVVQCRLPRGAVIDILGESDGFFRIRPPEGVTVWVSAEFVDRPGGALRPAADPKAADPKAADIKPPSPGGTGTTALRPVAPTEPAAKPGLRDPLAGTPPGTTPVPPGDPAPAPPKDPVAGTTGTGSTVAPKPPADVRPAPAAGKSDADELAALYAAASAELRRPVGEQDLAGLTTKFTALRDRTTDPRVRTWCEYYLGDLAGRRKLQAAYHEADALRRKVEADRNAARTGTVGRPPIRSEPPAGTTPGAGNAALPAAPKEDDVPASPYVKTPPADATTGTKAPPPPAVDAPKPDAPRPEAPKVPAPADDGSARNFEATGYLLESAYWDSFRDALNGTVRYRLTHGLPPRDLSIIWVQSSDGTIDLRPMINKKITVRGRKVYLQGHRSHLLLAETVTAAQ